MSSYIRFLRRTLEAVRAGNLYETGNGFQIEDGESDECQPISLADLRSLERRKEQGLESISLDDFPLSQEDRSVLLRIESLFAKLGSLPELHSRTSLYPFDETEILKRFEQESEKVSAAARSILGIGDYLLRKKEDAKADVEYGFLMTLLDRAEQTGARIEWLSNLQINMLVPAPVEQQFEIAMQTYLLGLHLGTLMASRAVLEAALRDRVPGDFDNFNDRLERAFELEIIPPELSKEARHLYTIGNEAAHHPKNLRIKNLIKDEDAMRKHLLEIRMILEAIYRVRGLPANAT